jgi:hypothetical protein
MDDSMAQIINPVLPVLVDNILRLANAYAVAENVPVGTVGLRAVNNNKYFGDLQSEKVGLTLRKYDSLVAWFASREWPEGHVMPVLADTQHYPSQPKRAIPSDQKENRRREGCDQEGRRGKSKAGGGKDRGEGVKTKGHKVRVAKAG